VKSHGQWSRIRKKPQLLKSARGWSSCGNTNWYYVTRFEDKEDTYISHRAHIDPYSHNTGYWRITDPEHPEHIPEELPPVAGPSTLTVPRRCTETLESEDLSPFQSAPNPDWDQEDQEGQEVKYYKPQTEQTTDVLAAQFQHILDLEDREPENPLTPQEPAYLHLIQKAVEAGFDIPPPPPLAEPEPELPAVVLPEQAEVQIAPAQPVVFAQQQAVVQVAPVQPIVQPIMAQQPAQQAPAQQPQ